jgi:hypothetical protein
MNALDRDINYIGLVEFDNLTRPFGLMADDRRRHTYIVGKSGMGKSTLLENMVLQDIYNGKGVAFIDPLGDSATNIVNLIPAHRIQDVIYFNPSDLHYPIGLNMLEYKEGDNKFLVASNLMSIMQRIWAGAWSARMEYIMNNTVLALLDTPGSTLLGVLKVFIDKGFRKEVANRCENFIVKTFWIEEFPNLGKEYQSQAIAAIQNKIGQFFSNDLVRNILGQPTSSIDFRKMMDEGKIFIANLSKGTLGEDNSSLLGAMLITKLQLAAMSRSDIPENERKDFYLYIDEFQNVMTGSFETILSEARKYRLNLIFANQYLSQLITVAGEGITTDLTKSIFGNVGTIICFQVSNEDAKVLAGEMLPESKEDEATKYFIKLNRGQVVVKIFVSGENVDAFSASTLPLIFKDTGGSMEQVVANSRAQFSKPREEVENLIAQYYKKSPEQEDGEEKKKNKNSGSGYNKGGWQNQAGSGSNYGQGGGGQGYNYNNKNSGAKNYNPKPKQFQNNQANGMNHNRSDDFKNPAQQVSLQQVQILNPNPPASINLEQLQKLQKKVVVNQGENEQNGELKETIKIDRPSENQIET